MERITTDTAEEKSRPRSMRYQSWNYAGYGWYHVTTCTKSSINFFGEADAQGMMRFNTFGNIVRDEWLRTAEKRSYVQLDEFCIMPDHFHGIIAINREGVDAEDLTTKNHWQSGCLGAVIGRFKAACAKRIREEGCTNFEWQRNFHDHIIRNEKDLDRIRRYIRSNPAALVFGREGWRSWDD